MNGLRKNVFYAFYFANMLGDELVAADDGYFITRKGAVRIFGLPHMVSDKRKRFHIQTSLPGKRKV
jgi:beta-xylosidase